jgi:hypothetical protein
MYISLWSAALTIYTVLKTKQISESIGLLEGKFPSNPRKGCLVTEIYPKISPNGDFLPFTLGNLHCFWDSVGPNIS